MNGTLTEFNVTLERLEEVIKRHLASLAGKGGEENDLCWKD